MYVHEVVRQAVMLRPPVGSSHSEAFKLDLNLK